MVPTFGEGVVGGKSSIVYASTCMNCIKASFVISFKFSF